MYYMRCNHTVYTYICVLFFWGLQKKNRLDRQAGIVSAFFRTMDVRCPVCLDTVRNPQYSRSRHVACKGCIDAVFATDDPVSPNTRTAMTSRDYYGPMYTDAVAVAASRVRVVMLADCSGSMSGSSANSITEAAPSRISLMIHFIKMLSNAFDDGFAVMSFSDSCNSIDLQDIDTLRPSGGTDMVFALAAAVSLHGTEPAFIMFTDGEPAAGTEAQTVAAFRAFGPALKLHVVGFGPSLNSAVMRELSANGTNTYINSVATAPIMIASLAAFLIAPRRAVIGPPLPVVPCLVLVTSPLCLMLARFCRWRTLISATSLSRVSETSLRTVRSWRTWWRCCDFIGRRRTVSRCWRMWSRTTSCLGRSEKPLRSHGALTTSTQSCRRTGKATR